VTRDPPTHNHAKTLREKSTESTKWTLVKGGGGKRHKKKKGKAIASRGYMHSAFKTRRCDWQRDPEGTVFPFGAQARIHNHPKKAKSRGEKGTQHLKTGTHNMMHSGLEQARSVRLEGEKRPPRKYAMGRKKKREEREKCLRTKNPVSEEPEAERCERGLEVVPPSITSQKTTRTRKTTKAAYRQTTGKQPATKKVTAKLTSKVIESSEKTGCERPAVVTRTELTGSLSRRLRDGKSVITKEAGS